MSPEDAAKSRVDVSRLRIRRDEEGEEPRRRGRLVLALLAVLAVAASVVGFWRVSQAQRPIDVQTVLVQPPDVGGGSATVLSASGYIVARRKAGVGPRIPGLLEWLGVEEGDRVQQGQVIGRLQSKDVVASLDASRSALAEARANLNEAQATLEQYRKERERANRLFAEGVISDAEFDLADSRLSAQEARVHSQKAAIVTAEARVRAAEVAVEDTSIRAPFAGTVLTKDAEEGETVAPAAAGRPSSRGSIITMADLDTLEVEVDVNEANIASLSPGQPARIVADSFPDRAYDAKIRQIIPTADRQKATVQVKVTILEPGDRLRPDMGARVTFLEPSGTPAGPAHPLPRVSTRALARNADGTWRAWVVDQGVVRSARVEISKEAGGEAEIRSGLSGGEALVLDPPAELADGRKVAARN